jgi:hypothetical protein
VREILDRVTDKWSLLVISLLADQGRRFTKLRHRIDGISQRLLTLRQLERDGLVLRTVHPVVAAPDRPRADHADFAAPTKHGPKPPTEGRTRPNFGRSQPPSPNLCSFRCRATETTQISGSRGTNLAPGGSRGRPKAERSDPLTRQAESGPQNQQ